MIEKQDFVQYTTMPGDFTNYNIGGFDPNVCYQIRMFTNQRKKVKMNQKV